ncbi:MAG: hypothetical protein M3065_00425 [Actinomycetota bacterium]|nr:hypothetical protein [Actinomycetota bacterium]
MKQEEDHDDDHDDDRHEQAVVAAVGLGKPSSCSERLGITLLPGFS